ncbi:twin-arginine translocase TatA/TatE family subunit [Brevibacterium oceani]|uniref:twin-arginine translocase TatA/TatE family subunit n=1 Tax=Brevibacterium oceani TaxID=358099 RepID=UPI0015E773DC|nr:twin-arginine translocase TatA/TatE family subunit [Brevibacterium oceani]
MLHNLTGWHALVILAIIILVFGAAKLPALAKSLGQSVRILKDETTETRKNDSSSQGHEAVTDPIVTDPVAGTPPGTPIRTSAEASVEPNVDPNLGDSADASAVRARS